MTASYFQRRRWWLLVVLVFFLSFKLSFDYVWQNKQQQQKLPVSWEEQQGERHRSGRVVATTNTTTATTTTTTVETQLPSRSSLHLLQPQQQPRSINKNSTTNTTTTTATNSSSSSSSPYAYAFVIGGCNPNKPVYKGFLYNILVSARILRDLGSTADIVAYFQLSYSYNGSDTLPMDDVAALQQLKVRIRYIPPSRDESFYDTVLNKFLILTLTQYQRVLLMDGDVMPLSNLDFLFQLSTDRTLKDNVVVAGILEPANAGFFMLTPGEGEYERLQEIISAREKSVLDKQGVKFDEVQGWGHAIQEGDEWRTRRGSGRNWTFHFAFSDQGLLYHWTKYEKKSVSIIYKDYVENCAADAKNGVTVLEQRLDKPFKNYSKPVLHDNAACNKFMCDFAHFTGRSKPWMHKVPSTVREETKFQDATHWWWYNLHQLNDELGLQLDFANWTELQGPALGLFASYRQMDKHIQNGTERRRRLLTRRARTENPHG